MKSTFPCFLTLLLAPLAALAQDSVTKPSSERAAFFEEKVVWQNKEENAWPYHVYGLVQSSKGALLAFAEGRQGKGGDADPHHLVLKRSTDGGRNWSRNIYVEKGDGSFWSANGEPGKLECWTNTGPIVDEKTGRVFFFYALNEGTRQQNWTRVFYRYSDDDGLTWLPSSEEGGRIEVTHLFADNPHGWTFHMPGPGHGIQLRHQQGKHADKNGRLMLAVWHRRAVTANPRLYGVSMLVSDDHGETWRRAGDAGVEHGMNEGRIVELEDGRILLNTRGGVAVRDGKKVDTQKHRVYAWSNDAGETFGKPEVHTEFEYSRNGCDSSIQRYTTTTQNRKNILLFSRPADPRQRARMTVSLSSDEGKTWSTQKLVHDGPSFYSDLAVLPDGTIGLLYGKGKSPHEQLPDHVAFAHFNLEWLEQPRDSPSPSTPRKNRSWHHWNSRPVSDGEDVSAIQRRP
ncbi:MAG: sialidase family protein [Verrucomicrobiales bacterium]|nr:sialidase family protein [Verrucomicrobiales bacterium]